LFLASIYWFIGPNYFAARVIQCFLTATLSVLTFLLGKELFDRRVAKLGAIFVALYPPLIVHAAALMTENLFMPLLLLALWLFVHPKSRSCPICVWMPALAMALAIAVRPTLTLFLFVVIVWFIKCGPNLKTALVRSAILLTVWLVVVTPWCIRNYYQAGRFMYLDALTGYNLYMGYNEQATGSFDISSANQLFTVLIEKHFKPALGGELSEGQIAEYARQEYSEFKHPDFPNVHPYTPRQINPGTSDNVMEDWGSQKAVEFIEQHPWHALKLTAFKFMHFWGLEHRLFIFAYSHNLLGHLSTPMLVLLFAALLLPYAILLVLAIVGIMHLPNHARHLFVPCGLILYYTAMHSVVFGEPRFRYVIMPIIALLSASGLLQLRRILFQRGTERITSPIRLAVTIVTSIAFLGVCSFSLYSAWDKFTIIFGPNGHLSFLPF